MKQFSIDKREPEIGSEVVILHRNFIWAKANYIGDKQFKVQDDGAVVTPDSYMQ